MSAAPILDSSPLHNLFDHCSSPNHTTPIHTSPEHTLRTYSTPDHTSPVHLTSDHKAVEQSTRNHDLPDHNSPNHNSLSNLSPAATHDTLNVHLLFLLLMCPSAYVYSCILIPQTQYVWFFWYLSNILRTHVYLHLMSITACPLQT